MKNPVGVALMILRKRAELGQRDIAEWCAVSEPTVSKWETGRVMPPEDQILHVLNVLDVEKAEYDWLVNYLSAPKEVRYAAPQA